MGAGDLACILGTAVHDCPVQGAVLVEQGVADVAAQGDHAADVGHHVALEQVEQTADGVQQHCVVAGFGDGKVKVGVSRAFFGATDPALAQVAVLYALECRAQPLAVGLGGAQRRIVGAGTLQRVTEFDQVALRLRVALQQIVHRVTE